MNNSIDNTQQSVDAKNLKSIMRKHPLFAFFFLAYAISWILTVPFILSEWGVLHGDMTILFVVKSFGPFAAALIMTGLLEGKEGVKRFRKQVKLKGGCLAWYLLILLGIPALIILGILVQPGKLDGFLGLTPALLISYPIYFVAVFFGGGPLGEEPGWRGFALPRMQKSYGPLVGTLLLAVLWTCWHLPDFLTSAQGGGPGTWRPAFAANFPIFLALVTSLAIIFTWLYNRNRGSIFMLILAHASVNTPQVVLAPLFPAVDTTSLNLAALLGFGVAALLILLFTRGRLGFQQNQ